MAAAGLSREKPPDAHTGGFGEPTCMACHGGEQLNAPGGRLVLTGLPDQYDPGQRYRLTVTLTRPQLQVGGFQVAARFSEGSKPGNQAGSLEAPIGAVAVSNSPTGIQYLHHTPEGISAHLDTLRWQFDWRAPATTIAGVIFHVAANASNDDASPLGDFIYAMQASTRPRPEK